MKKDYLCDTMKTTLLLISFLLLQQFSFSQNLVPNPSFEIKDTCRFNFGALYVAIPWTIPETNCSPDYFNSCTTSPYLSVPQNIYGYEPAHSGVAYSGIVTGQIGSAANAREYLQVELLSPLAFNTNYYINFFVSPGDSMNYVCNNFGVYFSQVQINDSCYSCVLPYIPQFENPMSNNLSSRLGWTKISGSYLASGGEKYIIIGNFRDSANSTLIYTGWQINNPAGFNYAYYYIDDVCVSSDSTKCNYIEEGIKVVENNAVATVFPNPATTLLTISTTSTQPSQIILYDIASRELMEEKFTGSATLNIGNLAKGVYLYQVRDEKGMLTQGKVVKE